MNRRLMGLVLLLAAGPAMADCKQDCRSAYSECSGAATTLDATMRCKSQYKECVKACDAGGLAAVERGSGDATDRDCSPVVPTPAVDVVLVARMP